MAETDTVKEGSVNSDIVIPLKKSPPIVQRIAPDLPDAAAQRRVYNWKDENKLGLLSFQPFNAPIHSLEEIRSLAAAHRRCCVTDHKYEYIRKRAREEEELNRQNSNIADNIKEEVDT